MPYCGNLRPCQAAGPSWRAVLVPGRPLTARAAAGAVGVAAPLGGALANRARPWQAGGGGAYGGGYGGAYGGSPYSSSALGSSYGSSYGGGGYGAYGGGAYGGARLNLVAT